MTHRPLVFLSLLVVGSLTLAACVPAAPPPPPSGSGGGGGAGGGGGGGGLPAAPGGGAPGQVRSDTNPDPAVDSWKVADAPDPFVLRVDPAYCAPDNGGVPPAVCYYAYSTMVFFNPMPVWRSSDLVQWHMAGIDGNDSNPHPDGTAVDPNTFSSWSEYFERWAPSVMQIGGQYVMWYAAKRKGGVHCLGVATASSPDGPFNDAKGPYCRDGEGGVIDPSPLVESSGRRYLTYKTEVDGGRIYAAELSSDGKTLLREGLLLTNGGGWESPRIEGPTLWRSSSGIHLFYSAGAWENGSYVVGVAGCNGPLGPCGRTYSTPVLPSRGSAAGPGGQTPFVDAGGTLQLAFHAWTAGDVGYPGGERSLRFLPVTWPGGNPKVG